MPPSHSLEGGRLGQRLRLSLHRHGVAAGLHEATVFLRILPGQGQRHGGIGSQSQVVALSLDDEPLYPVLVSGRRNHQVESVAVGVSAGGLEVANRSISQLSHITANPTCYPPR